jgi:hypothetical protein
MRLRALLAATRLPQRFKSAACLAQFSSLGSIDEKWLQHEMTASMAAGSYYSSNDDNHPSSSAAGEAAKGSNVGGASSSSSSQNAFAHMRAAAAATSSRGLRVGEQQPQVPLQLVWTTVREVQQSREGWAGGGSIPGRHDNVMRPFLMRQYCRCAVY